MSSSNRRRVVGIIIAMLFLMPTLSQLPAPYKEADATIDSVKNWHQLRKWAAKYGKYGFADISELESDFVVHTLATHWETLPSLARETSKHKWFLEYVLGHIDATTDYDELRAIISHSAEECPKRYEGLCNQLNKAASEALAEGLKITG